MVENFVTYVELRNSVISKNVLTVCLKCPKNRQMFKSDCRSLSCITFRKKDKYDTQGERFFFIDVFLTSFPLTAVQPRSGQQRAFERVTVYFWLLIKVINDQKVNMKERREPLLQLYNNVMTENLVDIGSQTNLRVNCSRETFTSGKN